MPSKEQSKSNAKYNEKAQQSMYAHLEEALVNAKVQARIVFVWDACFDSFRKSCQKYFGKWINESEVNSLVISPFYAIVSQVTDLASPIEPLSKYVSAEKIAEIARDIVSRVESLPLTYDVLFPLPSMPRVDPDFPITDCIALMTATRPGGLLGSSTSPVSPPAGILSPFTQALAEPTWTYLKVTVQGYISDQRAQSGMHAAIMLMKRAVRVGITKDIWARQKKQGLINALLASSSQEILHAYAYEHGSTKPIRIPLGLGMSALLYELGVNREVKENNELLLNALNRLCTPVQLVTDDTLLGHSDSLASSLEWAFDAMADDENVSSCVKTCIALEAALGEETEEGGGITERLADRFAYLLGNTAKERTELRTQMRLVYRLRSKLVHGKKATIGHDDAKIVANSQIILDMVLKTELAALERWSQSERSR